MTITKGVLASTNGDCVDALTDTARNTTPAHLDGHVTAVSSSTPQSRQRRMFNNHVLFPMYAKELPFKEGVTNDGTSCL